MTDAPALRAENVTKRFGPRPAIDGVSLDVSVGECVALIGESGAGKTTLLRCFNRLIDPDEGRILVAGVDARELDPFILRRRTGYVPQDGGLLPHWRVQRNVELVPWLCHLENRRELAIRALQLVGLEPDLFASRWPRELSGGQRQRVAVARALAVHPGVVLLDEPFGALDAMTRDVLHDEIERIWRERQLTVLFVTHNVREAVRLGDRVVLMQPSPGLVDVDLDIDIARPRRIDSPQVSERARWFTDRLQTQRSGREG